MGAEERGLAHCSPWGVVGQGNESATALKRAVGTVGHFAPQGLNSLDDSELEQAHYCTELIPFLLGEGLDKSMGDQQSCTKPLFMVCCRLERTLGG